MLVEILHSLHHAIGFDCGIVGIIVVFVESYEKGPQETSP